MFLTIFLVDALVKRHCVDCVYVPRVILQSNYLFSHLCFFFLCWFLTWHWRSVDEDNALRSKDQDDHLSVRVHSWSWKYYYNGVKKKKKDSQLKVHLFSFISIYFTSLTLNSFSQWRPLNTVESLGKTKHKLYMWGFCCCCFTRKRNTQGTLN